MDEKKANDEHPFLVAELPTAVIHRLRSEKGDPDRIRLAVRSDLAPDGQFGEQWLLIDEQTLWVIENSGSQALLRYRYALDDITHSKVERCVGNALMQVTVDDRPQVLLHYTNDLMDQFGRVAHYLCQRAEDGPETPVPDPNVNNNRCLVCGRHLLDSTTTICPKCVQGSKVARRLVDLARPYWGTMVLIIGLLVVGTALDLMPPYLTRVLIDDVLQPGGQAQLLVWVVLGLLGVRVVRVADTVVTNWLTTNVSARFTAGIRAKLFAHLRTLPIDYFDKNQVGRVMTRINTDTNELQGLVTQITRFALNIMLVIGIGAVLFAMSPSLGLYVLIPTPFVIAAALLYYRYMRPHFKRVWISRWRLNAMLSTFLSGVRVVRAFAQDEREESRYTERNDRLLDNTLQVDLAWAKFFPLVSFAFAAGGLIIWYAGGKAVLAERITLGTLMAFIGYLGMFYGPLSNLTQISQAMNRFLTISQRIFEMLDEKPQARPEVPVVTRGLDGEIVFDRVSFGYDPYYPVIKNLSFTIKPGEMVGVVGHSGAGKTTLINLLCRFYDVTSGSIRIDGVDIRDLPMEEVRREIGVVLQRPYLSRGTIAENIAYGRPDATREQIIAAAMAANAHDFITMMPEGYDTIVGEGGAGLSGGECQRVSIARAVLNNPKVLILDEATSSVDTKTERKIQSALDELVKGRTTIAIAHRLSTLYNADRIVVLNHGRLEEQGSPVQLMDRKGAFYNLVQMQSQFASLEGVVASV